MKNLFVFFSLVVISLSVNAQEQKVEIVSLVQVSAKLPITNTPDKFICSVIGVPIQRTSLEFNTHYDIYSHLSKSPSVLISKNSDLNSIPKISMRGDDNTIVIVDGILYDVSVLNTLNPADIESITVAPGAAATTYLRNN